MGMEKKFLGNSRIQDAWKKKYELYTEKNYNYKHSMWPGVCPLGKRWSNVDLTQDSSKPHILFSVWLFGVALQGPQIILVLNFCAEFLIIISEMFSPVDISPLSHTLPSKEDWLGVVMIQNGPSDSAWEAGLQSLCQPKLSVETSK